MKYEQGREKFIQERNKWGFVSDEVKCSHNLPSNFGAMRTKIIIMGKRISNY